ANVSQEAHASCLSFELSAGPSRIITNCGMPATGRDNWRAFARETAAHSNLVYRSTSSCQFVALTAMKRFLEGAPIIAGPTHTEVYREATQEGVLLTASHNGYARQFGVIHRRSILMSEDGARVDGEDALEPTSGNLRGDDDFAVRFHLHPAIKASRLADARAV